MVIHLHLRAIRAHSEDTAAELGELFPIGASGVHKPEISDGDVDPAVDAHSDAIRGMVRTAVTVMLGDGDVLDKRARRTVCHSVPVPIFQDG